jgi:hypothetical protein
VDWLVQAELLLERLDLGGVHGRTGRREHGHVTGQEVARGRLDHGKHDDREQEHQERQQQQARDDEAEHTCGIP